MSTFTCEICVEPYLPQSKRFINKNTDCSDHYPFCKDCIAKYIEVQLNENNTSEIKCPDVNCNIVLDPLSCRSILSPRVFERWCFSLLETLVLLEPSSSSRGSGGGFAYSRAYCPFRDCSELILNECQILRSSTGTRDGRIGIKKSTCPNCKRLLCFSCMVPWVDTHICHTSGGGGGGACVVDINDMRFMEMVRSKKWTRCPTCHRYVEHRSGCPIIICRCKTSFCFSCGTVTKRCVCWSSGVWCCVTVSIILGIWFFILLCIACLKFFGRR